MHPKILSKYESPLLDYAISKLGARVFLHPVWVRFGKKDQPIPPQTIQVLLGEAEQLRRENPSDACQVFLICAAYQNYSGQRTRALTTVQKALHVAERAGLSQERLWAIWGACAICVQMGNYEQASIQFARLQAALHEQDEWVLADYVAVLRQSIPSCAAAGGTNPCNPPEPQQFGPLLSPTFDWLYRWGFSEQSIAGEPPDLQADCPPLQERATQFMLPAQLPQGPWHTLRLMCQGELNLHWTKNDSVPTKSRPSLWRSALGWLREHFAGRMKNSRMADVVPQTPNPSLSPKETDDFSSAISIIQTETVPREISIDSDQPTRTATAVIPVAAHMLGSFSLSIGDLPVRLSASRGLSLLKYLVFHHGQNTPREVLMDVFWPDADPETARNNLNVAMHSLRKALRNVIFLPVICFEDGMYGLAPDLQVWLDIEEFERFVRSGKQMKARNELSDAVSNYEGAISLYQGDFLEDNPYEGWTSLPRERFRTIYLDTLDRLSQIHFEQERYTACVAMCQLITARDPCREDIHCRLMQCYSRLGQSVLALRQYQNCAEALRAELEVEPAPETKQLHDRIRRRERV